MFDLPPSFIAGLLLFSPGGGRRWALWEYGAFPNIQLVYLCIVVEFDGSFLHRTPSRLTGTTSKWR